MSKVNLSTISNQQGTRTVDVEDLIDNQQRIHVNNREVVRRLAAEAGLTLVSGSFEEGASVTLKTQVVWQQATGKIFAWFQDAVKTVGAGSTPETTGGISGTGWVDRSGETFRSELIGVDGDSFTGYATFAQIRAYAGSEKTIRCGGRTSLYSGDGAHGKFFRDDADAVSADNDGTVLVDVLGRRWKRRYTGRSAGEWFGIVADDSTADDGALLKALNFAVLGNPINLLRKQGVIRVSSPVITTLLDNTYVDIDFGGATIKPIDSYAAGTSDKLLQLNGGDSLLSNCVVQILNPSFDSSNIAAVNAITPESRRGIGGLLVQAAHTVNISNSKAKGQFYSASIFVNVFNTLNIDGHQAIDCGVKYSALTDYVGLYDAAGDAVYTANAVGAAKVSLKNVNSSSQSAYLGRAGFVSESGGAATSIAVKLDNCNFSGYQRITHQEDGSKSTLEWDGGTASRFSILNFTLAETKKRAVHVKNVYLPDINPTIKYGGKSGVYAGDTQDQAGAPFAVYENCKLGYSTSAVEERYGAEYVHSHILIGPGVAITKIACNDTYTDCNFEFTNSAGRIYYSNSSLVTISGGTSKSPTVNKTAWDLSGGSMTIKNGHKSKCCLPQVADSTELSHYEGVYDIGNGSDVTGEIFIGSSHKREFVDARIICPTTGFIELKGNAGVVNKLMDNVQTEGLIINYDTHNSFDTRASTRNLTQRFPVGNTPSVPFQYSNTPHVVHFGYLLDRNNTSVAVPASSGNIKYIGSAACNPDGSITAIV